MSSFDDDQEWIAVIAGDVSCISHDIDAIASQSPSRRERVATAALQGLMATAGRWPEVGKDMHELAHRAVAVADALIAELDKDGTK